MSNQENLTEAASPKKKLPKNVWAMGLVSLFNDISSEMVYPITPLFLKNILGAPAAIIGLIEGVAESTASLLKLFSGWLSDRLRKRKAFVTGGYALSGISKVLIGLAYSWPFVLFARLVDRFGKGARTAARDALILESVAPEDRGRAFGLHRSLDSLGAVFGPLLALGMIAVFKDNLRPVFFWAFIPSLIGVIVLLLFVREKKKGQDALPKVAPAKPFRFKWRELDPRLKNFLLVSAIFAIGNSSDAFLILRAQNLGLGLTLTVATYVLYNLSYSALSYPAGVLSDKIGPRKILAASFFLFAFVYLGFGLIQSSWLIWFLFPIYGLYMAMSDGISKAYIAETVAAENSGTAFGAYQMVIGLGVLISSLVAGLIWSFVSPSMVFIFGAFLAVLAGIVFLVKK